MPPQTLPSFPARIGLRLTGRRLCCFTKHGVCACVRGGPLALVAGWDLIEFAVGTGRVVASAWCPAPKPISCIPSELLGGEGVVER